MKEALKHLDTIEIQAPGFNCDVDSCSDGPITADQELPIVHDTTSLPNLKIIGFTSEYIPPISFQHLLAHPKTETKTVSMVNYSTEQP